MAKIYKVTSCLNCPNGEEYFEAPGQGYCQMDLKPLRTMNVIPTWCPLEDAPDQAAGPKAVHEDAGLRRRARRGSE